MRKPLCAYKERNIKVLPPCRVGPENFTPIPQNPNADIRHAAYSGRLRLYIVRVESAPKLPNRSPAAIFFRRLGGVHMYVSDVLPDAPQYAGRINDYEVTDAP